MSSDLKPDEADDAPDTVKQRRINFDETDTFNKSSKAEPPPPGSLAAWLAKSQQAAGPSGPPRPRSKRKATARTDAKQWWIRCDPLAPIPLGSEPATITIGRSIHADVVLPHSQVSRIHGKIKVQGQGLYTYEDNGSSNGSIINGEKAGSVALKVGDVISLGPYEITVHSAETLGSETSIEGDSLAQGGHTQVLTHKPQAAMTGLLSEVPITEILQGLEFNRKTGTLEVQCPLGRGWVTVCEGHPIQAKFKDVAHDEALITIATQDEGSFQFSGAVEPGEPQFRSTITALLLEATRRVDERG